MVGLRRDQLTDPSSASSVREFPSMETLTVFFFGPSKSISQNSHTDLSYFFFFFYLDTGYDAHT
jgi:hypothetical protein